MAFYLSFLEPQWHFQPHSSIGLQLHPDDYRFSQHSDGMNDSTSFTIMPLKPSWLAISSILRVYNYLSPTEQWPFGWIFRMWRQIAKTRVGKDRKNFGWASSLPSSAAILLLSSAGLQHYGVPLTFLHCKWICLSTTCSKSYLFLFHLCYCDKIFQQKSTCGKGIIYSAPCYSP